MNITKNKEIEASLIVYGESPEKILKKLAGLKKLANFFLMPKITQNIHDIYFDTISNDLLEQGFGLRVRNINKRDKITVKGNSVRADWGGVQRMEIEYPWGKQGWIEVTTYLQKKLTHLKFEKCFDKTLNPLDMLQQNGLEIIQERKNRRVIRSIVTEKDSKIPVAEFALDSLTFVLNDSEIYSYEIEIELKNAEKFAVLKIMIDELLSLFAAYLQVWEYSKLSTGRSMQQLWDREVLQKTLDKHNRLTLESYNLIREFRKSQKEVHN